MYDPNLSDAFDRCLFSQVGMIVRKFSFSFNQSLARVGTLTWQSLRSVIWVNSGVIYQNTWQESWIQNCLEKPINPEVRRLLTACGAPDKENESGPGTHRDVCF